MSTTPNKHFFIPYVFRFLCVFAPTHSHTVTELVWCKDKDPVLRSVKIESVVRGVDAPYTVFPCMDV